MRSLCLVGMTSTVWSSGEEMGHIVHTTASVLKEVGVGTSSGERKHVCSSPTRAVS
jgi:hypothetical protein